ncbi:hypothetical protein Rleg9DRAFT_4111 [Rhizobium leguminosarum bv. trifolii WSM597]|uniref:Uncharacterized protein n=1 Tax=Rhizobium leguminosarum bv. trifolii WSM597 TaxID=754764 RepID=I9NES4_RHILT|nr:hypothetical protein Rleg9DRAFT_4111 [Rhizobium leguminosarum bv. trifolii WSM597]
MASRRDNPLARSRLNAELPHHVIIWWGNYNSGGHAMPIRSIHGAYPDPKQTSLQLRGSAQDHFNARRLQGRKEYD